MQADRRDVHQSDPDRLEADGAQRRTAALAGLAAAIFLLVIGLFLVRVLGHNSKTEDCLLAGRLNCAPVATPPAN